MARATPATEEDDQPTSASWAQAEPGPPGPGGVASPQYYKQYSGELPDEASGALKTHSCLSVRVINVESVRRLAPKYKPNRIDSPYDAVFYAAINDGQIEDQYST